MMEVLIFTSTNTDTITLYYILWPAITFPGNAQWHSELKPDPVLLFRFSALTYNSHKVLLSDLAGHSAHRGKA